MCEAKARLEHCIALRDHDRRMDLQNFMMMATFRRLAEGNALMIGYQLHHKKVVWVQKERLRVKWGLPRAY